jgi:hypothetical protein
MVDLMSPQTVLTPADAGNQLQSKGLDVLGLTIPALSKAWSASAVGTADDAALTLGVTSPLAPFKGTLRVLTDQSAYSDVAGAVITGTVAVLELHPEARHRLQALVTQRLGGTLNRPVPVAMLVHGVPAPSTPQPMSWLQAGESLGLSGARTVSFHDSRGLPIDAVAVAALFGDLVTAFPALSFGDSGMPARTTAGGLDAVIALAGTTAIRCHVISPHGATYRPVRDVARLEVLDSGGTVVAPVPDAGLASMAGDQRLGRATTHATEDTAAGNPLYWGWAINGTLTRAALGIPTLPGGVTLARQFFRVMAVDLPWHLLGNRRFAPSGDPVPDDDHTIDTFALPAVRAAVPSFDYLIDGSDALGSAGAISAGFPPAGTSGRALLVSPTIDATLALPPGPGAVGHWPAFPGPVPVGPPAAAALARFSATDTAAPTATWRAGTGAQALDAIVTFPADVVPAGTHLRIMPRTFVVIDSIGQYPSFVRGDGGSAIAQAGVPTSILVPNPFLLTPGDTLPNPGILTIDIVAAGRDGSRRMLSSLHLTLGAAASWTDNLAVFGGTVFPGLAAMLGVLGSTSIAPASLFGIARTGPAPSTGTDILSLVRGLANETTSPRVGPHLPAQGRFETVLALGVGATPTTPMTWNSVLTGARWTWESRSVSPELGDPGNPAGPDVHAAGVRVGGQLAWDLAIHAIKRAQPVLPWAPDSLGWLVQTAGDNWNEPPVDTTGTVAAAMLETIAPFCDSPELAAVPMPQPTDSIQSAVSSLATALGVTAPTITAHNEDRLRRELQREIATAANGQRDALWSLHRAIKQAREYVYIESPMFAKTSRGGTSASDIDLVEVLRQRLHDNPRLKVIICVPRNPDFALAKKPYVRAALKQRKEAVDILTTEDRTRVAAFQPIGFPGRPTLVRSTVVLVDDVFALVGTSHLRRRGMTFDGGVDVASMDRALNDRGVSAGVARFRQELMATRLGITIPTGPANTTALWTRLAEPDSAFYVLADLLAGGGLGRCAPVWAGPTDTLVIPATDDNSDPNGVGDGPGLFALLVGLISDS